jgi:hypothetical protein
MIAIQELLGQEEPLREQPASEPIPFANSALDRDSQEGESGPIIKAAESCSSLPSEALRCRVRDSQKIDQNPANRVANTFSVDR